MAPALGFKPGMPDGYPRPFAWQAWHLVTSTFVLRGRRGTYGTGLAVVTRLVLFVAVDAAALCVAGVALGDIDLRFAWQAWRLVTSTFALPGRRGTWRHRPSFCVAGVAHTHTIFHTHTHIFVRQLCYTGQRRIRKLQHPIRKLGGPQIRKLAAALIRKLGRRIRKLQRRIRKLGGPQIRKKYTIACGVFWCGNWKNYLQS